MFSENSVRRDGLSTSFFKRVEALLVPLVLWSWITAAFLILAGSLTNRGPISLFDALLYPFPPKDIFWFLWALFVIQTLASLVAEARSAFVVAAFAVAFGLLHLPVAGGIPSLFQPAVQNLPYFLAGILLARSGRFPA
ncbi:hypothetical protein EON64_01240, partial [archaeon]